MRARGLGWVGSGSLGQTPVFCLSLSVPNCVSVAVLLLSLLLFLDMDKNQRGKKESNESLMSQSSG